MNNEIEQRKEFEISIHGEKARIKRNFKFSNGVIDLDIEFKMPKSETGMTLKELNQASLNLAIQELKRLLDLSSLPR